MHQQPGPYGPPPGQWPYGPPAPQHRRPGRGGTFWILVVGLPLAVLVTCVAAIGTLSPGDRPTAPTDVLAQATETGGTPEGTPDAESTTEAAEPEPSASPSPEPTPRTYRGAGAKVLKLRKSDWREIWLVTLTHDGSSNFIVRPLAPDGESRASIVNEIGRYQGTVLLNEGTDDETAALQIEADGAWTVALKPLSMARTWSGDEVKGHGDDVLAVVPPSSGLTIVEMQHSGRSNFIVHAYSEDDMEYLVNEIGKWSGEVPVPDGTFLITVDADGDWTFRKT